MYTIEATYIIAITFLVFSTLISGTVNLHNKVTGQAKSYLETEIASHTKDGEKEFRPEEFMRGVTIFEKDMDTAGQGKYESYYEAHLDQHRR